MRTKQQIIAHLRALADDPSKANNFLPFYGICTNVGIDLERDPFYDIVIRWPKYTGVITFPVPATGHDPISAYDDIPLWKGEYGANRRELAAFIADELEKLPDDFNLCRSHQTPTKAGQS